MNTILRFFIGAKSIAPYDSTRNKTVLAITYFFYFGLLGIFVPYVGLFLDGRGFDSSQIGLLLALVALSRILGPNLWANIADKTGKVGDILRLGTLLAFLVFLFVYFVFDYWLLTLTFCVMMMFWTAVLPQLEVITVKATHESRGGYGALRMWGSLGFICCSLLVGSLIDIYHNQVIIIAASISLLLLYFSSLFITSPQVEQHKTDSPKGWFQVISLAFIVFIIANTLLQISFGTFYNFFALYLQDLGYSGAYTGMFIAIGVIAEVFIFIFARRILKRFDVVLLLGLSILLTAIRWLLLAYFAHLFWVIVASQLIHALSFGLTHAASVHYLTNSFSSNFQSRAQAIYVSVTFGLGGAVGSYLAGELWQQGSGAQLSFVVSASVAFIGAIILVMLKLYDNKVGKHAK